MPDTSFLSLSGAKLEADAGIEALAGAKLRCFKSEFEPTITSTLADFVAAECDFDGYAMLTITAWQAPVLAGAAYAIFAPTQVFRWVAGANLTGNQVGGTFLVLGSGELYDYTVFDPSRPCMGPDQAIITTPTVLYPAG